MRITSTISLLVLGLSKSALSSPETAQNYPRQVPVTQPSEWVPWERINRNDSVCHTLSLTLHNFIPQSNRPAGPPDRRPSDWSLPTDT
jgi:hypothetical protein